MPIPYTTILNNYRSTFDETLISNEMSNNQSSYLRYSNELALGDSNPSKLHNPIKLRGPSKEAIVLFKAYQKVFKARFDEGRSNARLQDLSNSFNRHLFVTALRTPYESLLKKNKESFFNVNSYKKYFRSNFNETFSVWNSLNVYFADLPFLVSMTSDPAKYLWFGWASKWSSKEIQAASSARFSLLGVPYTTKVFEYNSDRDGVTRTIKDSENYLVRLARARKNYITNWAYTPYFYSREHNWYSVNNTYQDKWFDNYEEYPSYGRVKGALNHALIHWGCAMDISLSKEIRKELTFDYSPKRVLIEKIVSEILSKSTLFGQIINQPEDKHTWTYFFNNDLNQWRDDLISKKLFYWDWNLVDLSNDRKELLNWYIKNLEFFEYAYFDNKNDTTNLTDINFIYDNNFYTLNELKLTELFDEYNVPKKDQSLLLLCRKFLLYKKMTEWGLSSAGKANKTVGLLNQKRRVYAMSREMSLESLFSTKNKMTSQFQIESSDLAELLGKCQDLMLRPKFSNWSKASTPSHSGVNTPGRSSWRPQSSVQSYNYNTSVLVDILTKREYLYRQYYYSKRFRTQLPKYLLASPKNPLLKELKAAYPLIDPVTFSSEISRENYHQNRAFLRFKLAQEFMTLTSNSLSKSLVPVKFLSNYTFFYLFGETESNLLPWNNNNTLGSSELYKNQYRPMKKGVTNMIKLHSTGAIALPIEIRLHILASSKDVIHSWAIPSAGIKIDCIPGYSSHRVAIFLVAGIFWGQCMEVCGRFHHWMPIIVYFMKRDLFFLWCTHFIHYSTLTNEFLTADKKLSKKINLVSYSSTSWVKEINKIL